MLNSKKSMCFISECITICINIQEEIYSRIIVLSRSGPTEIIDTGTPVSFSINATYSLISFGRLSYVSVVISVFQPLNSL